jgi:hydrogenase maturation factor
MVARWQMSSESASFRGTTVLQSTHYRLSHQYQEWRVLPHFSSDPSPTGHNTFRAIVSIDVAKASSIPTQCRAASVDMDPITGLLLITVVGIVLLLGLFGVCARYAYLIVRSHTPQEER